MKREERGGHIGDVGEEEEGTFAGSPREGGDEGASRMVEASQLACLSPRRTSSGAGPAAWECGRQSPGFCRGPPREAACSSSWPGPCCSRPSRSTFAVRDKREKSCSQPLTDSNKDREQGFVVSIKDNMEFSHSSCLWYQHFLFCLPLKHQITNIFTQTCKISIFSF